MEYVFKILRGTPLWVYLLFLYLLWRGIRAFKPQVVSLSSLFIFPLIFMGLSLYFFKSHTLLNYAIWGVAILLGMFFGWNIGKRLELKADKKKRLVALPGGPSLLIGSLIIFGAKYFFGVLYAIHPEAKENLYVLSADLIITGLVVGLFLGKTFSIFQRFDTLPHVDLLENKQPMPKAIIVGASSGIGRELAKELSSSGYELGLVARRKELLLTLQQELPTRSYVKQIDIAFSEVARQELLFLIKEMGGVDLIVLNAGVGYLNPDLEWGKEKETIDVNVLGFCACANVAMKAFFEQKKGHLVAISSIAALRGNGRGPAYAATKAFISNYMEGLRQKVVGAKLPITITDIKPGFVDTAMAKGDGVFWVIPVKTAASEILKAIQKKKAHAYITFRWRFIAYLLKIIPRFLYDRF